MRGTVDPGPVLSVQRNHNYRCLGSVSRFGSGSGGQLCEVGGADPVRLGDGIGVVPERGRAAIAIERRPSVAARLHAAERALADPDPAVRDQAVREAAEIVQAAYREVAGGSVALGTRQR